jgi:diguanylate cyclase (GGDEF)-like protein
MANPFALFPDADLSDNILLLNYATGLFSLSSDEQSLVRAALETCADFGHSNNVAFFRRNKQQLELITLYGNGEMHPVSQSIPLEEIPSAILNTGQMEIFDPSPCFPFPFPAESSGNMPTQCLCLPVANKTRDLVGMITLETDPTTLHLNDLQALFLLTGIFGISLDNMYHFKLAITDGLTGVFARRYFDIRIAQELAKLRRKPGVFSILLIDLDHFKEVNDTLGHETGDRILCFAADTLTRNLRQDMDIICRYGGDEFIVIMPDTTEAQAGRIAERIRREYRQTVLEDFPPSMKRSLTASVLEVHQGEGLSQRDLSPGWIVFCIWGKQAAEIVLFWKVPTSRAMPGQLRKQTMNHQQMGGIFHEHSMHWQ